MNIYANTMIAMVLIVAMVATITIGSFAFAGECLTKSEKEKISIDKSSTTFVAYLDNLISAADKSIDFWSEQKKDDIEKLSLYDYKNCSLRKYGGRIPTIWTEGNSNYIHDLDRIHWFHFLVLPAIWDVAAGTYNQVTRRLIKQGVVNAVKIANLFVDPINNVHHKVIDGRIDSCKQERAKLEEMKELIKAADNNDRLSPIFKSVRGMVNNTKIYNNNEDVLIRHLNEINSNFQILSSKFKYLKSKDELISMLKSGKVFKYLQKTSMESFPINIALEKNIDILKEKRERLKKDITYLTEETKKCLKKNDRDEAIHNMALIKIKKHNLKDLLTKRLNLEILRDSLINVNDEKEIIRIISSSTQLIKKELANKKISKIEDIMELLRDQTYQVEEISKVLGTDIGNNNFDENELEKELNQIMNESQSNKNEEQEKERDDTVKVKELVKV
ncbi:MAG: Snf7 family protein [Oligoflexia bacterium]|nr:Snf7 family protein [Oligoflexia bacterium]